MGELSEVCDVCGKDFQNRSSFSSHLKTHEDKEYNCHCCKAFSKRQTLQYHKQTAHDSSGSSIKCDCCDKEFKRKSELQKHLKERDFKETFQYCKVVFENPRSYRKHLLIHEKIDDENSESFSCDVCGKTFLGISRLRDHHSKFHNPKNNCICSICNKTILMSH